MSIMTTQGLVPCLPGRGRNYRFGWKCSDPFCESLTVPR